MLDELITAVNAKLVIVDPVMSFLDVNAYGDQSVRRALTPLKQLAERRNVAVVLVRHLTKGGGRHALYRGGGSIGIMAATRSALLVGQSPDDENLRVLCHTKSNLGQIAPSLLFEPMTTPDGVVRVEWRGSCEYTSDDLLAQKTCKTTKLDEAMDFLMDILNDGPVPQQQIKDALVDGLSWRTVERAKTTLGVESVRSGFGPEGSFSWQLAKVDEEDDMA